jgi:hypothetical protein
MPDLSRVADVVRVASREAAARRRDHVTTIPSGWNAFRGRLKKKYAPETIKAKAQIKFIVRRSGRIDD